MSGSQHEREQAMLRQLIALEELRLREQPATGLTTAAIQNVTQRLIAQKTEILADFDSASALQITNPKAPRKFWIPAGIAAILLMGVGALVLLRLPQQQPVKIAYQSGAVKQGQTTIREDAAIQPGSAFVTGESSVAAIRFGDFAVSVAGQRSEWHWAQSPRADEKDDIEVVLKEGTFYTHLEKNRARFNVTTEMARITVTGTRFMVLHSAAKTRVLVADGAVEVQIAAPLQQQVSDSARRMKLLQPIVVSAGRRLQISADLKTAETTDLTADDTGLLQAYDNLATAARERGDSARFATMNRQLLETEMKVLQAKSNANALLTLDDIKKRYGKISRVNLLDGRSFTGFFKLTGPTIEIITPRGTFRIPTAALKNVEDQP